MTEIIAEIWTLKKTTCN